METTDFLIAGSGIIGLNIARELKTRFPKKKVVVLEKESISHAHSSGRNSGVLHAGFYYTKNSLKAKFTREGNKFITEYCERKKLNIRKCGKLVVASKESHLPVLDELLKRGEHNGIDLEMISDKRAEKIEPRVKTIERAIFSPSTSSVDPQEVVCSILEDCIKIGIDVRFNDGYVARKNQIVISQNGQVEADYFINSAGLYADKIALDFGFSQDYRVLPFKGLYLYSSNPPGELNTHIYPVPDLKYPFLGVHFTVAVDGKVKMGPTAIPAFWREQYSGFNNFKISEFLDIINRDLKLVFHSKFDFTKLAFTELKKYFKPVMVSLGSELLMDIVPESYKQWGRPGIRAQLVDIKSMKLVTDFILEGDQQSMHILNAVSPGFTCSAPFAAYVCDEIMNRLNGS